MADKARKKWRLPSLSVLGDPSLSLARHLKASGLLDVFISRADAETDPWTAGHPYMSAYTNGVAQPATLVVTRAKDVWYSHTTIPSSANGGGVVARPMLGDVWQEVRRTKLSPDAQVVPGRRIRKQTLFATNLPFLMLGAGAMVVFVICCLGYMLSTGIGKLAALRS